MVGEKVDFTLCFRRLFDHACAPAESVEALFEFPDPFIPWLSRWRQRLEADQLSADTRAARMGAANPVFIPRNHLVEEVIRAGEDEGDFVPFHQLVERLAKPDCYAPGDIRYATPPTAGKEVKRTFCGT